MSIYKSYFGFKFNKIFWSRLAPIHIGSDGLYYCDCCNKHPHECENKASAVEYDKIRQIVEKEDGFGVSSYLIPIKQTGYLRADLFGDSDLIWKIQRELAKAAGFSLRRSSFF